MLFTLEPLPAAEGDCLLIHWGTAQAPSLAVIDGGPGRIYDEHLRPRLEEILANRGLDRLPIELVMVSHVDNDHIVGVKKLFRALRREADEAVPPAQRPLDVKRLWHNSFNDVLGDGIDRYYETLTASVQAAVGGKPNPQLVADLAKSFKKRHGVGKTKALDAAHDIALVLAGHAEGRDLRIDHRFLFDAHEILALNAPFKNPQGNATLITAEKTAEPQAIAGLEFRVVGPRQAEIEALQDKFDKYIKKEGLSVEAVLAAYSDDSVTNISSIVCLASFGNKTILLTGDARGDKITEGLKKAGMLKKKPMKVDILKVPHHGSDRNLAPEFFEKITADAYVFSGNGKHGNPDRSTLEYLVDSRGKQDDYAIYLTYPIADTDRERKADYAKKGKTWSAKEDSLKAFFEDRQKEGYAFTLRTGAPVKIELGDEPAAW
jgi:beta-lactamase superfamily II metal-dependent hydrolase